MPIPPKLLSELIFFFDYDFPLEQIDEIVGLKATESKRFSQTRINPITKIHNSGYWLLQTETISSYNIGSLLQIIEDLLSKFSSGWNQIIQQYRPSCFMLRIRILVQQEDEFPGIRFEPEFLQYLSLFNITIDIEIENDLNLYRIAETDQS